MGRKKGSRANSPSKKKARNTIELKKEIIKKYESGIKIAEIGRMYRKSPSTISSIITKKEAIKEANVAKGVNMLTKQRSQAMEDMEQLLLNWINQKQLDGDSVSEAMACEKARLLYADLIKKMPGVSDNVFSDFKASRGWFEKFKRRTGVQNVTRHGKDVSSDKSGAEKFASEVKDHTEALQGVTSTMMDSTSKELSPGSVYESDFDGFELSSNDPTHVLQSNVHLGESMDSEVNGDDVEKLADDHNHSKELTTEELQDIHLEVQQTADEEVASDEAEDLGENMSSSEIEDIFSMWSKVQGFVEKNHPDKAVAGCICNLFNSNILPHFSQILKKQQKQSSLDNILV